MKSDSLKASAKNNAEKDFEFAYFDSIDDALAKARFSFLSFIYISIVDISFIPLYTHLPIIKYVTFFATRQKWGLGEGRLRLV